MTRIERDMIRKKIQLESEIQRVRTLRRIEFGFVLVTSLVLIVCMLYTSFMFPTY